MMQIATCNNSALRREEEVLTCGSRVSLDPATADRLRSLLAEDLDWDYLIEKAKVNSVVPLLWRSLNAVDPDRVPLEARTQLHNQSRSNFFFSLQLTRELLGIVQAFEQNGVPIVPYKGPVLAATAYGDLGLRTFVDLDALVRKEHVLQAKDLLGARGYRSKHPVEAAAEKEFVNKKTVWAFVHEKNGVAVDLHWGVTLFADFFYPVGDDFWESLSPVSIGGVKVSTMRTESLLQVLCIHGSRHGWSRLQWICDIAELLRSHPELDWNLVLREAKALGNRRMLLLGLRLANELLEAPVPDSIAAATREDKVLDSLAAHVRKRLFGTEKLGPNSTVDSFAFQLKVHERLSYRLRHFFCLVQNALVPTARERSSASLPSSVHYLLRPFRLIGKYGLRTLKIPAKMLER